MGNHDWYLTRKESCPRSHSANVCLNYQRMIVSSDHLSWLFSLPKKAFFQGINIVHGGWNDPLEEYITPSLNYFSSFSGELFASGHTHVSCIWEGAGKHYCNPGSVGQPRDGNPEASFAFWDGSCFHLKRVKYNIKKTQEAMIKAGFSSYFYENLSIGSRIGGKIDHLRTNTQ
jgi:diadenosine tetraphosphatase ApaH/serine/threonine PP2A family protein phosphatase